jgi:DNA-binding NarL/FixJ family response regulator
VSLTLADACAALYERALTLLAFAALHITTGNRSDARQVLDDARAVFVRLGARPALAQADTLAARLNTAVAPRRNPAGLTAREIEVLRLVVAGRTNREIADLLSVSTNTVMNHVTHILTKTNAENRAAAAAFALRHGLA